MNKIIVTGGLGFIGTNLINKLAKDKNNIILNIDKITYCSNLSTNITYFKSKNYFFKRINLARIFYANFMAFPSYTNQKFQI